MTTPPDEAATPPDTEVHEEVAGAAPDAQAAPDVGRRENLLVPGLTRWTAEQGPLISLRGVHKSFGKEHVLRGIDLEIPVGEITVIVGASPSGKSVLIKLMNGLLFADRGEVRLFGEDPRALGAVELDRLRKRMGTLFQNYALFDSMTVAQNVAFPLVQNQALASKPALELAAKLITELDLPHAIDLFPSSLSGGMKKRVALARAIVANPEVVLYDEPTTGLDPIMMEFVDDMIRETSSRYGLTSVIISHDMASTFRLASSIAVLYEGQIIAHDTPAKIKLSEDERVRRLIFASDKSAINLDVGGGEGESAKNSAEEQEAAEKSAAVVVRKLRKSFDDLEVLKGIDLTAPAGKITVLIGGSGSGKSVLMKHILGLFKPNSGTIRVLGEDVESLDDRGLARLRTQIGMLFQHAALFDSMTIYQNIMFPLLERREAVPLEEAKRRADEVIEKLKLTDIAQRTPPEVSNGQQKRASLARALVTQPRMMIYDEPTTGQDPIMCDYVEQMILDAHEAFGLTSVIISHDMASTFRVGDHVAMLYHGEIIAEGPPASLLTSEDERVRAFVFAADIAQETGA